jgi:undecaprenyl-diphosphatase
MLEQCALDFERADPVAGRHAQHRENSGMFKRAAIGGDQRYRALAMASFAALAGIVLFKCVKHACRRARPCEQEPHCWATMLPPDQFSFPSGHTITAFAIAVSLGHLYPHSEACLFLVASCIGASRVILGMHYLSDVVAGAVFGAAIGFGSYHLFALL